MCRIGFGVCVIGGFCVFGSVALFRQRHGYFGSVLLRQTEGPFDPWLAGFRNGMQSCVDTLGRQLPPDERAADSEMESRLPLGVEWSGQAKDEAGKQKIDLCGG